MNDGLNKALLIGHLGQEPDLRYTNGGKAVLNLSLAVTSSFYDDSKEKREHTEWIKVTVWGSRAEKLAERLSVGARVSVEGSIRTNKWTDKEGRDREQYFVNASHVYLIGAENGSSAAAHKTDKRDDSGVRRAPSKPQHRERYAPNGPPNTGDDVDKWF